MTDQEVIQALDRLKSIMIAVATGGPRIGEVQTEFVKDYDVLAAELARRQIKNPLPYRDLWEWYGRWSSGDMPSWQSRRQFVNALVGDIGQKLRVQDSHRTSLEPTGWDRVDRTVTEVRKRLETGKTEEQFQAVGLLCREALISLAQAVYNAELHPTLDEVAASDTDANRMLEAYMKVAFVGSAHEYLRKHARAAYALATHLQHRRTATFREAAACMEATTSIINLIAIMAGLRDP
jgi:hypothetical protein